jgi:cellulose biosynthesis protein BcsQ
MKTVALLNRKGGAGKTTTAVALAFGVKRRTDLRVGLVDCDPNGSSTRWLDGLEMETVACRADQLALFLEGLVDDFDVVFVDSPPNDELATAAIARVSDLVLLPVAPAPVEIDQLPDTIEILKAIGVPWLVVPVRVRMSTASGQSIRKLCEELNVSVTKSMVPLSEAITRSFGEEPPSMPFGPLVTEVLKVLDLSLAGVA